MLRPMWVGLVLGSAVLTAGVLDAQEPAPVREAADARYQNDCRLAEQVLATGHPAPHTEWAINYIAVCGGEIYGRATAEAVRRLRTVRDTAVLRQFWRPSHFLTDIRFYDAATEIARDRSASPEARVYAFLTLVRMSDPPRYVEYDNLVGGFFDVHGMRDVRGGCRSGRLAHAERITGVPLPPDFRKSIRGFSIAIRDDEREPIDVRTSAACAAGAAR
jgi:hypothetical protein